MIVYRSALIIPQQGSSKATATEIRHSAATHCPPFIHTCSLSNGRHFDGGVDQQEFLDTVLARLTVVALNKVKPSRLSIVPVVCYIPQIVTMKPEAF